jgi:competence protein ComEC
MHPSRILTFIMLGFTGGVLARSFFVIGWYGAVFVLFIGMVFFILVLMGNKSHVFLGAGIMFIFAALGIVRYHALDTSPDANTLVRCVKETCTLDTIVVAEPDIRENGTRLTLEVSDEAGTRFTRSRILAYGDRYPTYHYGDSVRFTGKLVLPEVFASDDTGRVFDYPAYLRKDGIAYQAFRPSLEKTGEGVGNPVYAFVLSLKEIFLEGLSRALPEPQSSLAGGLIVGTKRALGEKLLNDFRATGVIHLVVLSGYNVTIVAEAAIHALSFLPAVYGSLIGAGGIVFFTMMTGAGATVVRASLMALLVILARYVGRPHAMERGLMIAGVAMIAQNPFILVFDASFQLSFLATLALIFVVPIVEPYLSRIPERFGMREIFAATIATQIFVMPYILWFMGDMSLVALPVNVLILGVVPTAMFFGFVGGLAGIAGGVAGMLLAAPAYVILAYMLGVVDVFVRFPFSIIHVPVFPFTLVVFVYVIYVYVIYVLAKKQREREMFF